MTRIATLAAAALVAIAAAAPAEAGLSLNGLSFNGLRLTGSAAEAMEFTLSGIELADGTSLAVAE